MRGKRASATERPGPLRWSYRSYVVHERAVPFGRRFEVRSPKEELVLFCRAKRSDPRIVFFADEQEATELFRLEPRRVRQFDRAYDVVDPATGKPFAQLRKKVYGPLRKMEWFIVTPDGEPLGMVTDTAAPPSLLRRLLPVDRLLPKSWAVHWGQSIAGTIQPRPGLVGERIQVDLPYDTKDEVDRRLVLAVTVALRADLHQANGDQA